MEDDRVKGIDISGMIVVYDGKEYRIQTEDSQLVRDIEKNLPLQLQMRKNGEAEYTGILPFHPVNDARPVTKTVPNAVYQSGKSTTPDRLDQTWMNCLNLFDAEYNV